MTARSATWVSTSRPRPICEQQKSFLVLNVASSVHEFALAFAGLFRVGILTFSTAVAHQTIGTARINNKWFPQCQAAHTRDVGRIISTALLNQTLWSRPSSNSCSIMEANVYEKRKPVHRLTCSHDDRAVTLRDIVLRCINKANSSWGSQTRRFIRQRPRAQQLRSWGAMAFYFRPWIVCRVLCIWHSSNNSNQYRSVCCPYLIDDVDYKFSLKRQTFGTVYCSSSFRLLPTARQRFSDHWSMGTGPNYPKAIACRLPPRRGFFKADQTEMRGPSVMSWIR